MSKFKKGERVRRILDEHYEMNVGDIATVISDTGERCGLKLREFGGTHMRKKFKLTLETPTHIILWNKYTFNYIAYEKKDRDEKIKELVDNKEIDNDDIVVYGIKSKSKISCDVIIEEIK